MNEILNQNEQKNVNHKKQLKVVYLQKQVAQLQDQNKDLREIIALNKKALNIALNNEISNSIDNDEISENINISSLKKVEEMGYQFLQKENEILLNSLEKLTKDRNFAQSKVIIIFLFKNINSKKALINQQIAEETEVREFEIIGEFEEKIKELRSNIQDKEILIQYLEKKKPFEEQNGIIVKNREVYLKFL